VTNLRDIKKRINSVTSTQQITRTMEMVATAKIKRATDRIVAATPYATAMAGVLVSLVNRTKNAKNPLMLKHQTLDKVIVIVIASDRGMAGGFNSSVLRAADHYISQMETYDIACDVIACGRKAIAYFKYRQIPVVLSLLASSADPTITDANRISAYVIDSYTAGQSDQVILFYNHAKNVADQTLRLEQVLPITDLSSDQDADVDWEAVYVDESAKTAAAGTSAKISEAQERTHLTSGNGEVGEDYYEYMPTPRAVLDVLLPDYVRTRIYHALLDSAAGEQGARRKAMKSATDNANEMIATLMRMYNRARQTAITTEIAEIVGGAAALEVDD
jgi:F-type H+-transporting ATPase subunit gamma